MCDGLVSERWNDEYSEGRYAGEPPVEFVKTIIGELERRGMSGSTGLYVGCGNGRNYIPLADAGLDLYGIDVSGVAIDRLSNVRPSLARRLSCQSMDELDGHASYDYIVSIQVFQHGNASKAKNYFRVANRLLNTGGVLFLRVNSAGTEVHHSHKVTENLVDGGFTARYTSGPKAGLDIHFFSTAEIAGCLDSCGFSIIGDVYEKYEKRDPPKTGRWAQFEVVAEKTRHLT